MKPMKTLHEYLIDMITDVQHAIIRSNEDTHVAVLSENEITDIVEEYKQRISKRLIG